MQIIQSRRDFLAGLSAAGAAGVLGARAIARQRGAAGGDHGPPGQAPGHLPCASVRRRGAAARRRLHRYPLRGDATAAWPRWRRWRAARWISTLMYTATARQCHGCRRAAHGGGRRASRLLRAVRARAHPHHQRLEGQEGRHPGPRLEPGICWSRSWRRTSGSIPTSDIDWVTDPVGQSRCSCSPRARSTRSSAFRPSRRSCARATSVT